MLRSLLRHWCRLAGHRMKFGGGSPFCLRCWWEEPGGGRLVLPARETPSGDLRVVLPGDEEPQR